jgi:hypothetical protein
MRIHFKSILSIAVMGATLSASAMSPAVATKESCPVGYPMETVKKITNIMARLAYSKKFGATRQLVDHYESVLYSSGKGLSGKTWERLTLKGGVTVEGDIHCGDATITVTESWESTDDPYTPSTPVYKISVSSKVDEYCRKFVRDVEREISKTRD